MHGVPVFTYFTGTGAEADHQLGGAITHVEAMARRHLGIKGDMQFVTVAQDDDWLGKGQDMSRQTANMLSGTVGVMGTLTAPGMHMHLHLNRAHAHAHAP